MIPIHSTAGEGKRKSTKYLLHIKEDSQGPPGLRASPRCPQALQITSRHIKATPVIIIIMISRNAAQQYKAKQPKQDEKEDSTIYKEFRADAREGARSVDA